MYHIHFEVDHKRKEKRKKRSSQMKLLLTFRVILIGFIIITCAEVWGEDWRLYWEDPFANYYYDADKINHPTKNVVRIWQKIDYTMNGVAELVARSGEKFKTTSFSTGLFEFDCSEAQYKELQSTFFSKKATYLGEQTRLSSGSISQGSVQEKLYKIICKSVARDVEPIESTSSGKEVKPSKRSKSKLK